MPTTCSCHPATPDINLINFLHGSLTCYLGWSCLIRFGLFDLRLLVDV